MEDKGCQLSAIDVEKIKLEVFNEEDTRQHQMKLLFGCGFYAAFRGSSEHTYFCKDQVTFGTYPVNYENDLLAGKPYVAIDNFANDKTKTITCTNSYSRDTSDVLRFPVEIENMACFGGTIARYYKKLSPGQVRMYCRVASREYRKKMGIEGFPDAAFYPQRHLGRNSIADLFREGGAILGLPEGFRPHALRSACITQLVNDQSVSIAQTMAVARHTSVSASKTYQRVDGISEGNRLRALGLLPGTSSPSVPGIVPTNPVQEASLVLSSTDATKPVPPPVMSSGPRSPSTASTKPLPSDDVSVEWVDFNKKRTASFSEDEDENFVPPFSQPPSMTQVGIQELEEEVKDLKSRLRPRKAPVMSQNRRDIEKLRETVRGLKREIDSRDHDILYHRSLEHDQEEKLARLTAELEKEKSRRFRLENILGESEKKRRKLQRENGELERIVFGSSKNSSRRKWDF